MKQNMDFMITAAKILQNAVHKNGLPIEDAFLFITSAYQATEGFIKVAAPFKYVSKVFAYGRSKSQQTGEMYREEHQPQASYIGKILMWGIKHNKINLIERLLSDVTSIVLLKGLILLNIFIWFGIYELIYFKFITKIS